MHFSGAMDENEMEQNEGSRDAYSFLVGFIAKKTKSMKTAIAVQKRLPSEVSILLQRRRRKEER